MGIERAKPIGFISIYFIAVLILVSCGQNQSEKLTIAAAANMQFTVTELTKVFSEQTGIECETVTSSSGKLTAQIIEGAPFDVLLSADMKFPEELHKRGLTLNEPLVYAYGNLVLWTLKNDIEPVLESLSHESIKHIAMGNPKTAPYGISAMEVLHKTGLEEKLQNKLVFGESISQTNQFIISMVADVGFTSKSVVLSSLMKGRGTWKEIDKSLYKPITQGIVVVKNRKIFQKEAIQFKDFLLSAKGKEILYKFGYQVSTK